MADGINKTNSVNNEVVAPDIGNAIKAFVQNETVQKVADTYMEVIKGLNRTPPQHYRGITENLRRVGISHNKFSDIRDKVLGSNKSEYEKAFGRRDGCGCCIDRIMISDRPRATESAVMLDGFSRVFVNRKHHSQFAEIEILSLHYRGFVPTGNKEVKALIKGLINMFK